MRFQSACEETKIQTWQQGELEPNLVYNLRIAFSQTVQAIEQARTEIGRTERLRDATETAALSDVDSAYATVMSTIELLKPHKNQYLRRATDVRETMSFSYTSGGASLLDFLDAQNQYQTTELT